MSAETNARASRGRSSAAALVAANLVPLAGVLLWDWDVAAILVLYWFENVILGALTIVKLIAKSAIGGALASCFFVVHYGGFCGVHGVLILALTMEDVGNPVGDEPWPLWLVFVQILVNVTRQVVDLAPPEWLYGMGALLLSHLGSLVIHHFRGGERSRHTIRSLMAAPYKRIVLLHIVVLFGGWGVILLGSPVWLIVALVSLKMFVDVRLHRKEHGIAPAVRPAATSL